MVNIFYNTVMFGYIMTTWLLKDYLSASNSNTQLKALQQLISGFRVDKQPILEPQALSFIKRRVNSGREFNTEDIKVSTRQNQ